MTESWDALRDRRKKTDRPKITPQPVEVLPAGGMRLATLAAFAATFALGVLVGMLWR